MSQRWPDVIRKNGRYITDGCVLFTINLRYEIRQDLVISLIKSNDHLLINEINVNEQVLTYLEVNQLQVIWP